MIKYSWKVIKEKFPEYKLIFTDNGYEAITLISSEIPSLIITKHDLPLMDGMQLLKSIRKGEKGYKVPVIAITSDIPEETKMLYNEYGLQHPSAKTYRNQKITGKIIFCLELMLDFHVN